MSGQDRGPIVRTVRGDIPASELGVMLANGSLYASDMLSGLWQVAVEP